MWYNLRSVLDLQILRGIYRMSAVRKTYDTDVITLRGIYANSPGTNPPITLDTSWRLENMDWHPSLTHIKSLLFQLPSSTVGHITSGNVLVSGLCTLSTVAAQGFLVYQRRLGMYK
jgi:hypothetical protein